MKKRARRSSVAIFLLFFALLALEVFAQHGASKKPVLIRDTGASESQEEAEAEPAKEPNPLLAEQNLSIGNFYLKRRNYIAAIQRFLEALEYQPDSIPAMEALAKAYEKNGEINKAIGTYRDFLEKYPDSPKSSEFHARLAKLEKKTTDATDFKDSKDPTD